VPLGIHDPIDGAEELPDVPIPTQTVERETVLVETAGVRRMMAGKPYGERPTYNGPYVD
jgi:hypothetical protein